MASEGPAPCALSCRAWLLSSMAPGGRSVALWEPVLLLMVVPSAECPGTMTRAWTQPP